MINKISVMNVARLDHFTLRTARLEDTKNFFVIMAGLRVGPRPPFLFPGYWLYKDDVALLRLAAPSGDEALEQYLGGRSNVPFGSGAVDHIAFRCTGLSTFMQLLRYHKVAHRLRTVPELGEHQVFVTDPNSVIIEFIFPDIESLVALTGDIS